MGILQHLSAPSQPKRVVQPGKPWLGIIMLRGSSQELPPNVNYFWSSISPGRHVLSNHGSSGPYSRRIMNQPFLGMVWIQLCSSPAGALGPKYTSTDPSAFVLIPLSWLLTLGAC